MSKRFNCGHFGNGQFCHRCAQASKIRTKAESEKDPEKSKELKAEAERLVSVPKKESNVPMPSAPVPT